MTTLAFGLASQAQAKKSHQKVWGGGGGGIFFGGGGEVENMNTRDKSSHILYTRHIVTISSTEPYSLMKIFLMVFRTDGIVALTIKKR